MSACFYCSEPVEAADLVQGKDAVAHRQCARHRAMNQCGPPMNE